MPLPWPILTRLLRLPRNDGLSRFQPLADAAPEEPAFIATLNAEFGDSDSLLRAYLIRANVNEVDDVLMLGVVFGGGRVNAKGIRRVDALWNADYGMSKLLAIIPLTPDMEQEVESVARPCFESNFRP